MLRLGGAGLSPHLPNGVVTLTISTLPASWRVSRVSESPCTGTGLRRQVFRLAEPACRQTATETRTTCQRKPKTPARGDSNSGNLPQSREIAARRPGNSGNLPIRRRRLRKLGKPASSLRSCNRNQGNPPPSNDEGDSRSVPLSPANCPMCMASLRANARGGAALLASGRKAAPFA